MSWLDGAPKAPPDAPETHTNKNTGNLGEDIATSFLTKLGYQILERNFRCKGGEVDIVARDPKSSSLVFVEVKTRRDLSYGLPQLAVTPFKQRQLSKAALTWLSKKHLHNSNARFDVIAIILDNMGRSSVEHIVNAFDLGVLMLDGYLHIL